MVLVLLVLVLVLLLVLLNDQEDRTLGFTNQLVHLLELRVVPHGQLPPHSRNWSLFWP